MTIEWVVLTRYGRHFPDHSFKRIFLNENVWIVRKRIRAFLHMALIRFRRIAIKISLKFVPNGPINNIPALVITSMCGLKLDIHFQTSTVQSFTFGKGEIISAHTLRTWDYLSILALNVIHVSWPCSEITIAVLTTKSHVTVLSVDSISQSCPVI